MSGAPYIRSEAARAAIALVTTIIEAEDPDVAISLVEELLSDPDAALDAVVTLAWAARQLAFSCADVTTRTADATGWRPLTPTEVWESYAAHVARRTAADEGGGRDAA
jgi:hypothetical protein